MVRQQHGFSLIELMVVVGLMSMFIVWFTGFFRNSLGANNYLVSQLERVSIANTLMGKVSCANSLNSTTCTSAGRIVPLLDSSGRVIVATNGTVFGKYTARAECGADLASIIVRVTRLAPGGTVSSTNSSDFLKDPLTKKVSTWSDNTSLLTPQGTSICPSGVVSGWVDIECDGYATWPSAQGCEIRGNVDIDRFCQNKGYKYFSGECRHDSNSPLGAPAMGGPGFPGVGSGATVVSRTTNKWTITCHTYYFQIPDQVRCTN